MCLCTPNIRTPFCGKPGCEMLEQAGLLSGKHSAFPDKLRAICDDIEGHFTSDERLAIIATLLLPFLAEAPLFGRQLEIDGDGEDAQPIFLAAAREPEARRQLHNSVAFAEAMAAMGLVSNE